MSRQMKKIEREGQTPMLMFDNSVFIPLVLKEIEEGRSETSIIIARGVSMRPFIEDGRDKLVVGKVNSLAVGDVILAEVMPSIFICHRVVRIENGMVTMRGDGNVVGTETFPLEQARAKVVQVVRKGKTYTLATSKIWKVYSALWPRSSFLRRYLLALYRLLWMRQIPARLTVIFQTKKSV